MTFTPARLLERLLRLPTASAYWLAYSGGCDSHVLLHAMARLRARRHFELRVLHVNHNLHADAESWSEHCQRICDALQLPLTRVSVDARSAAGQSPEAAAREARYRVFADCLQPGEGLLLAQHRDDQAETLMLQLLRGSGPQGLAAMPQSRPLGQGWLGRPLLDFSRQALRDYARAEGLDWIEDPSNFDVYYDRNFLRQQILPALRQRWPSLDTTFSRVARYQCEAAQISQQQAEQDWLACQGEHDSQLCIAPLLALSEAAQNNLLRHWISRINGMPVPDARHLQRLREELIPAAVDAAPRVHWAGCEIRRFAGQLYLMPQHAHTDPGEARIWDLAEPLPLGSGRVLSACPQQGRGLSRQKLAGRRVEVRFRQGGETCKPAGDVHTRQLKKLLQQWQVPPWQRSRIPLVYVDGELAAVVGHCLCAPYAAADDEAAFRLELADPRPRQKHGG